MSQEATICYDKICAKLVVADQVISSSTLFGNYINSFKGPIGSYESPLYPLPDSYKITINLYGLNSTNPNEIASSNLLAIVNPVFPNGFININQIHIDNDSNLGVIDLQINPVTKTMVIANLPDAANFKFVAEIQVLYV